MTQDLASEENRKFQIPAVTERKFRADDMIEDLHFSFNNKSEFGFPEGIPDFALIEFLESEFHAGEFRMFLIQQYEFEFPVDEQPLSNACRKMVKMVPNLNGANTATAAPLVQFFAATEEERQRKLEILETAEIACVGIDDSSGHPYRAAEIFGLQASAVVQIVPR